jgi:hypothetical protein
MVALKNLIKLTACIVFVLSFAGGAQAGYEDASLRYDIEQPKKLGLQYDVYAGGFKALNAELVLDLDRQAYDMELKAQTQGFIGALFPWKGDYSTSGHAEKGALVPSLHTASSAWRDTKTVTEMNYDPKGRLYKTTTAEKGKTVINRDIDPAMSKDAVDMLTSALLVMQHTRNTSQCDGNFPVFDGKRRFNVQLKDQGKEILPHSRYSKFSGEALKCTVEVKPVAGFTPNDQKRGWMAVQNHTEARHKLPTLWLARVEKAGPLVPVRVEIASEYGSVVAHLTGTAAE